MIRLAQSSSLSALWKHAVGPWLADAGTMAWKCAKPVAVVVPSVAVANALKSHLIADKVPLFGVEFLQPRDVRRVLAHALALPLPVEDPRLIAAGIRSVAQATAKDEPDNATARALARSSQALADTLAMLESSGWGCDQIHSVSLRSVARTFKSHLSGVSQTTVGEFDFALLDKASSSPTAFSAVLILEFNGLHWENWPLLVSAARLADEALVTLPVAFDTAGEADLIWCASWENVAGTEIVSLDNDDAGHSDLRKLATHLDQRFHTRMADPGGVPVDFFAAESLTEEARAAALRAAKLVATGVYPVGVLVPGPGALAREVTLALERLGIVHYTTLPGCASPVPHAGSWPALLDALADGTAELLSTFLSSNGNLPLEYVGDVGSTAIAKTLDRVAAELLIADLATIREILREDEQPRQERAALRDFLQKWPELPATADFGTYLERVRELVASFGWNELEIGIADALRQQQAALKLPLSREAACEWLRVALPNRRVFRTSCNGNPYARVQVMTPTEAAGQSWGHLIFAGQTEGSWPTPLKPAGYLGEEAVRSLNAQASALNRKATRTGVHGEGSLVVRDGKGYCLGPIDERFLLIRDLIRLIENTSHGITFSAACSDESDGDRALQPGDFYRRTYTALTGDTIDGQGLRKLVAQAPAPTWMALPKAARIDPLPIQTAWKARNTGSCLTEYEFTLGGGRVSFPVVIMPSAWGRAFDAPTEVFLEAYLGVDAPRDEVGLPARAAVGTWTHAFVDHAAKTATGGDAQAWIAAADFAADRFRTRIQNALAPHGRTIPSWWQSLWTQARGLAIQFAGNAGGQSGNMLVLSEQRLPLRRIALKSGRTLTAGGRLDLVLSSRAMDATGVRFSGGIQQIWDLKTGSDRPLRGIKSLVLFEGLQLAVYMLALDACGAGEIEAGIVRDGEPWSPQLRSADIQSDQAQEVFERLARMQEEGLFGWTGVVRDPYSALCRYPLATLPATTSATGKFRKAHGL